MSKSRRRLTVFRADSAEELGPGIMPGEGIDESVLEAGPDGVE